MNDASPDPDGGGTVPGRDRPPPSSFDADRHGRGIRRSDAAAAFAFALIVSFLPAGCGPRGSGEAVTPAPARPLSEVLADHTPELMKIPGVVGTAESQLGNGRPCILVMVVRLTPEVKRRLPSAIEGWPVRIADTGEIHAMPDTGR